MKTRIKTGRYRKREGRCYEIACCFVFDNEKWHLIHGAMFPNSGRYAGEKLLHAWAKKGNIVYDPVFNKFFETIYYQTHYRAVEEGIYTKRKALRLIIKHNHYGPWQEYIDPV